MSIDISCLLVLVVRWLKGNFQKLVRPPALPESISYYHFFFVEASWGCLICSGGVGLWLWVIYLLYEFYCAISGSFSAFLLLMTSLVIFIFFISILLCLNMSVGVLFLFVFLRKKKVHMCELTYWLVIFGINIVLLIFYRITDSTLHRADLDTILWAPALQ